MGLRIAIVGAAGRMGRRLIALANEAEDMELVGAIEAPGHVQIGQDAGVVAGTGPLGLRIQPLPERLEADVVIDFSSPKAVAGTVRLCGNSRAALVIGTTGLDPDQRASLEGLAALVPVVWASNMSVGMNLLFRLVGRLARALGPDYDIEIVEAHHRFKKDAPSGSAMTLAQQICQAMDVAFPEGLVFGRHGKEVPRTPGAIGIHSVRAGDITGIHTVIFGGIGETITITHTAHNRDTFVLGALRAARWVVSKRPGLYSMPDVLGLE